MGTKVTMLSVSFYLFLLFCDNVFKSKQSSETVFVDLNLSKTRNCFVKKRSSFTVLNLLSYSAKQVKKRF